MTVPLHFEEKGTGLPLLCLHGHPGSSYAMSVFTESLSQRFHTISPDLRGYGKTGAKHSFKMSDHLDDLEQLLNDRGISDCWVLGWSLGGIVSMELALRFPHRVKGLILIGTAAYPRGSHPPISWQDNLYTGIASIINWIKPAWRWNIETLGKRSLYRYLVRNHTDEVYRRLATEGITAYFQTTRHATKALQTAINQRYNRVGDLALIQCPSLVLAGECDRHITADSSEETAEHLPNSTYRCYSNVAHLFPWEIPDQMLTDIHTWLDLHVPATPTL